MNDVLALARSEDDPPVEFGWLHIEPFVQQVILAAPPAIPCPVLLPAALTVETFKTALPNLVRVPGAATRPQNHRRGTSVIPGDQEQYSPAITTATMLNFDPWFHAVAISAAWPTSCSSRYFLRDWADGGKCYQCSGTGGRSEGLEMIRPCHGSAGPSNRLGPPSSKSIPPGCPETQLLRSFAGGPP